MLASAAVRHSQQHAGPGLPLLSLPCWLAVTFVGLIFATSIPARAADLEETQNLFRTGKYDECAKAVAEETAMVFSSEPWHRLKLQTELAQGKYVDALVTLDEARRRFPASIPIHLLGREVYRLSNKDDEADEEMGVIETLARTAPYRYSNAEGRVALGRFFLLRGADARKVLDQFFDIAVKQQPDLVDAHLATAELALEKDDNALAAATLAKAPKTASTEPRFHYLTALAFSSDDRAKSEKAISEALAINPKHTDSLLLRADHLIDGEQYTEAEAVLKTVLEINPRESRALAYRAVLAHLRADTVGETAARNSALGSWAKNPEVDHLIGRKLSQKYRFAEGSEYQRKALTFDPEHLGVKLQLCQDLLRLGDEDGGWTLAEAVFAKDSYNIVAFNLMNLRDKLKGFATIKADGFIIRMDPREAELYGTRVVALLSRAKQKLSATYGVTPPPSVIVEIFPQKKEFAVRTFGLPGADGFLGVCFGNVVTANSPASQGEHPSNWEGVLWHEFCHVITLTKTKNKMPRWLSEGISVYEEERENPAWASTMRPEYRAMILGEGFTPLSKLSSAFLSPGSALKLQFAYYESALAIEFLVKKFGPEVLNGVLDDLGRGVALNEALPTRTKLTLSQLDDAFTAFAKARASAVAPELTWEKSELSPNADSKAILAYLQTHPKNFDGLRRLGAKLVAEKKVTEAREALERFKTMYPEYLGPDNAYALLATLAHGGDAKSERAALAEWASKDGNAFPALLRMSELDESASNWPAVADDSQRLLAINPLRAEPHRRLALASEKLGKPADAVIAYRAAAVLDESDPAGTHYRLARLLQQVGNTNEARREVLKSLENAPRFLDAHKLLLELTATKPKSDGARSR